MGCWWLHGTGGPAGQGHEHEVGACQHLPVLLLLLVSVGYSASLLLQWLPTCLPFLLLLL
jgi:hypothetical protein